MLDDGTQCNLEKIQESVNSLVDCIKKSYSNGIKSASEDMCIVCPPNMGRSMIYESLKFCDGQSMIDLSNAMKSVSVELEHLQPSNVESEILQLKSQLKHCKNPLQKLNMEREMNKLIRERKEITYDI